MACGQGERLGWAGLERVRLGSLLKSYCRQPVASSVQALMRAAAGTMANRALLRDVLKTPMSFLPSLSFPLPFLPMFTSPHPVPDSQCSLWLV